MIVVSSGSIFFIVKESQVMLDAVGLNLSLELVSAAENALVDGFLAFWFFFFLISGTVSTFAGG